MLPKGTVEAEHIWKRFRADRRQRSLLRDQMARVRHLVNRNGLPRWRWALQDASLVAEPGESIGLVGINGSGKTTLLRILTRVMYPNAGSLQIAGRVGALIEVRAGIHPDLTGRENVFLYGSLLGLSRKDVARRFDEIVSFAEVEDAIDRQVKFYSSGMQMRIGFAVAAFLDPDVLLVDEVLAVGDASFQQKCLDRMREILIQGTTLVFVSHDLAAVEATCSRGIWLHQGQVAFDGSIKDALDSYRQFIEESAESTTRLEGVVRVSSLDLQSPGGMPHTQEPLEISMNIESPERTPARIFVGVSEGPASPIFVLRRDLRLEVGETQAKCTISRLPLPRGRFYLWLGMYDGNGRQLLPWQPATYYDVAGPNLDAAPKAIVRLAPIHVETSWEIG